MKIILTSILLSITCFASAKIIDKENYIYIVRNGDNLSTISKRYFGTSKCKRAIFLANRGVLRKSKKTKNLSVGQKIYIPRKKFCKYVNSKYFNSMIKKMSEKKELVDYKNQKEKYWELKLQVTPIKFRRVNKERDVNYGGSLSYVNNLHELNMNFEESGYSSSDELTGLTISGDNRKFLMTYDVNKYFGRFTYFNLLYMNQEKSGDIYTTKLKLRAGPIGVKYDIIENNRIVDEFSLSFIPLYEYIIENVEELGDLTSSPVYKKTTTNNLRASWRMRWKFKIGDKLTLKNTTFYRPAYLLDKKEFDFDDMAFENISKLSLFISENFSVGYINKFTYDVRKRVVHHMPSSDMEHTYLLDFGLQF